jgi:thymidine phosphorylase
MAPDHALHDSEPVLRARRLGIDTFQHFVVYMRVDCPVCRSQGFSAQSRIEVRAHGRSILATLNLVVTDLLGTDEAALSESAWRSLGVVEGSLLEFRHPEPLASLSDLRAKLFGHRLDEDAMLRIITDVAAGRYSDLHLAAFIAAGAGANMDLAETIALTKAMVRVGTRLTWPDGPIVDKHCVGGLPGNRTTPIVVAIVASLGLVMPKTSSRAITSPSGTADTMETLAPVDLDIGTLRRVVEREHGCIAWGGAVQLSPADDVLIRVERPLDIDSEAQLVASVLSKKAAAGSGEVVIDIPVGPTAKVRTIETAGRLAERLVQVGTAVGLHVRCLTTDGSQPVGRGVGPALEAGDVLAVLDGDPSAPADLRERALRLAAEVIEMAQGAPAGGGVARATAALASGEAKRKFDAIRVAQGGVRQPGRAPLQRELVAIADGTVAAIDNRRISRFAKLAGAPRASTAGLEMHVRLGDAVRRGQPLLTLHAETQGEMEYAVRYVESQAPAITIAQSGS